MVYRRNEPDRNEKAVHRVSAYAVASNLSHMHRDMAQRLAGHARNGDTIAIRIQKSHGAGGLLLVADVATDVSLRCSFFVDAKEADLAAKIAECLEGNDNSKRFGRKALVALCDRRA